MVLLIPTLVVTAMSPSADLSHALQILGLTSVPLSSEELARLVAARHPAS